MCIDSNVKHEFTFTPSISLYVSCDTEQEIDRFFEDLSQGGGVLMPLDSYGFSKKYCWIVDKFGVAWQLNLQS
jgi:predicted 3-demethylubiquinone-9 3-methyltransferase (glyoxalase superfamily)